MGLLDTAGFLPVLGVVGGVALLALVLAASAFSRVWTHGDLGGRDVAVTVLVASLVLAPFGFAAWKVWSHPRMTDIATDADDPPALSVAERTRTADMNPIVPFTPEQKALLAEKYPDVTGRRYDIGYDRVIEAVDAMVAARGWAVLRRRQAEGAVAETTIEAEARTFILGFPADVALRLTDEDGTTYVDMRSAWRYGAHDLGDNADRVTAFLTELDVEMATLAGVAPAEPPAEEEEEGEGPPADGDIPIPEPSPQG
jgi:hypothetical protein